MIRRLLIVLAALTALVTGDARAQPAPGVASPSQEQLGQLAGLLRDPAIQAWLQAAATSGGPIAPAQANDAALGMSAQVDAMRTFVRELVTAIPRLPAELGHAWLVLSLDLEDRGILHVLLLLAVFMGLGFVAQGIYWWATGNLRRAIVASPLDTVSERLRAIGKRLLYGLGWVLVIALGSIGGFLLFDWPPLLKEIVLRYLGVFLVIMLTRVLARFLLAPGASRFRIVPMSDQAAWFWTYASIGLIGWFMFIRVTLELLALLGVERAADYAIGMAMGLTLLAATLWVVWRRPPTFVATPARGATRIANWLLTGYLVLVWLALFAGTPMLFYVGIILLLLPMLIVSGNRAVAHVLRPVGDEVANAEAVPTILAVALERGLRAFLLIGGAYLIAHLLGVDFGAITARDTTATRLLSGVINAIVIALVAELAWHMLRAWIDGTLAESAGATTVDLEEVRRRARLRTLLPILRNVSLRRAGRRWRR